MNTVYHGRLIWITFLVASNVIAVNAEKIERCFNDQNTFSEDTVQLTCSKGVILVLDFTAGPAETGGCRVNTTAGELCQSRFQGHLLICNGKFTCEGVILKEPLGCPGNIRLAYRFTYNCIEYITSITSTQLPINSIITTTRITRAHIPLPIISTTSGSNNDHGVQTTTTTTTTTKISVTTPNSGTTTPTKTSSNFHEIRDNATSTLVIVLSVASGFLTAVTSITVFCLCRMKQKARIRQKRTEQKRHVRELGLSVTDTLGESSTDMNLNHPVKPIKTESPEMLYWEIDEDMLGGLTEQNYKDHGYTEVRVDNQTAKNASEQRANNVNIPDDDNDTLYLTPLPHYDSVITISPMASQIYQNE